MNIKPTFTGTTEEELYEHFQEWLDACPVVITDYQDFTDEFIVKFNLRAE